MDLTIEDLRSELEKRGLDSAGEQKDLRSRFEKALQDEKGPKKSLETNQTDTSKKTPESEDTTKTKTTTTTTTKKKEEKVQEEAMVATKEGEVDTEKKDEADVDEKDKAETSKVQTVPPSSAEKTDTAVEKESTKPTLGSTTPQKETTAENDAAAAATAATVTEDNNSVAETKDSAANPPPASKGEENESLIVLVDDTQNDLDADLLAKEKAIGKAENKKSDATSAAGDGSTVCPPEAEAKSKEDGQGDKANLEVKTEKKADEKKDDKDGKLKSSSTSRVKSPKAASSANRNGCNLWISGLSSNTKATHLKGIFAKYGKVVGAKVVTNARSPGARCYGFLTMSSPEEAAKCIQHLNRTKINNQTVTVKSAKTTPGLQPINKIQPEKKSSEKGEVTKSEEKSPNKKPSEKKVTEKNSKENVANKKKLLEKSSEKKNIGKSSENKKSTEKKPDKVKAKKDGKALNQSEKVESHSKPSSRSSSDKTKMLSPSKTKTPSKTSSHSPRHTRHHRPREHSTGKLARDFKLTLELKQRKNYLKREVRRQERQIDHARLVELELQRSQKEEAYRLDRVREELRMEREKLERERLKLERAEQSQLWKERRQADMFNGFERERHAMKRPYDRKTAHNDNLWDEMKRPNMGSSSASTSRFGRSFSDETWFGEHEDNYDRRGDSYYNRDGGKPMESVGRFSDSNHGRINHSPQRAGHERYGPPENSSRLADHVSTDNRFERRDLSSVGYHGHDTDHRNLAADRERELDRRNVSAHERLGRLRNQLVGGSNWKVDNWSHSHGGVDTGHQWMGNNMNPNYERGNGVGGSRGFVGGSGSSSSGAQNLGAGNMFKTIAQTPGMMASGGGGGGSNLGSRMQEPRFDAYKNMEHGGNRRY